MKSSSQARPLRSKTEVSNNAQTASRRFAPSNLSLDCVWFFRFIGSSAVPKLDVLDLRKQSTTGFALHSCTASAVDRPDPAHNGSSIALYHTLSSWHFDWKLGSTPVTHRATWLVDPGICTLTTMPKQQTDASRRTNLLWGAVIVAATFSIYWIKPFWPVTVRPFSWLAWASPFFIAFLILLSLYGQKTKPMQFLISSVLLLAMYFFVEGFGWQILFSQFDGLRPPSVAGHLFIGFINVLANLSTIAVFIFLQFARRLLIKASTPCLNVVAD